MAGWRDGQHARTPASQEGGQRPTPAQVGHPAVATARTVEAAGNLGSIARPAFRSVPESIRYLLKPTWDRNRAEIVHELVHSRGPAPIRVFRHRGRDDESAPRRPRQSRLDRQRRDW